MALRTSYVGSGLGLKPIAIGTDPYRADSEFDSTVRIPSTTTKKGPTVPASVAAAPTTLQPPAQPQIQPQMQPPPAPPTVTQGYPGLDPSQLNYNGQQANLGVPPTVTGVTPAQGEQLTDLERWLGKVPGTLDLLKKQITKTTPNPEYQIRYFQQELFNAALDRLKLSGASGARDQDEELMAMLASRGLLDSGIAAREISKLQEQRNKNYYDAVNQLNQMILQGDISRLTARDLATLEADLQKRNSEALLRLQQQFASQNQPNGLAQIIGTAAGTALPFLLGGGGSGAKAPSTDRLYGEQPGSTYRRPPESIL